MSKNKSKTKNESKCKECTEVVINKGIQCEVCDAWSHIQCIGLPEELYKYLETNESLQWYCTSCNKGIGSFLYNMKAMEERLVNLEKKVDKMHEAMAKLESKSKTEIQIMKEELVAIKAAVSTNQAQLETAIEAKLVENVRQA